MTTVPAASHRNTFLEGKWKTEDSASLYSVHDWGKGYFSVGKNGTLLVHPDKNPERAIDIHSLIEGLHKRGVTTPTLLRFPQILADRMREIHGAFTKAIADHEYTGDYHCVYPIKVNQQRHVVEEVRDLGAELGFGLEAGSKPELLAVLGMTCEQPGTRIICNGFKDNEFIEMVILATKLGRNIVPVVEKFSELKLLIEHAKQYDVRPHIGIRVKIAAVGAGRWGASAGPRSKFGLFLSEAIEAIELLKAEGMEDCLKLLHFHIGSQICDIRRLKNAVTELAHIYTEMRRLGAGLETIDIGGGLAVDYDGSQTNFESSMNYTIDEYAADVVYRIKAVCDEAGSPHPTIVSESGRALVAYSSLLVFDVLGVSRLDGTPPPDELETTLASEADEIPQPLLDLLQTREHMSDRNLLESYHDATQARDELVSLFGMGYVSLPLRALGERLFWSIGRELIRRSSKRKEIPEELAQLPETLSDIYFCNMSIFQSLPDSWAIDQLFPILPIHRLNEQPDRLGTLADITCDSDGKIGCFVNKRDVKHALELHAVRDGEPYYLAAALVGAYQEILGDLHNLLGDTHAVHATLNDNGETVVEEVVGGDTVAEVLSYVQIDAEELLRSVRREAERAVRQKALTSEEAGSLLAFYEHGLHGYTYLE